MDHFESSPYRCRYSWFLEEVFDFVVASNAKDFVL